MGFEDVSISSPEIQSPPPAQHQPAVHQPSTISNSYSSPSPPPSAPLAPPPAATPAFFYKGPPTNNSDPRVKDTVELCHFAVAALKVINVALLICYGFIMCYYAGACSVVYKFVQLSVNVID